MQYRGLILVLLLQIICFEGGFASVRHRDDWNNWIILPANSRINSQGADIKSFSGFRVNQSEIMNSYFDPLTVQPYLMTISRKMVKKRDRSPVSEKNDNINYNLVLPIGRAIEKVKNFCAFIKELFEEESAVVDESRQSSSAWLNSTRKLKNIKKKYKKFVMPLLIAYKLKFLTLVPVLIGGLILLVGTTGMAGFFFALFAAVMSLKSDSKIEVNKW